MTDFSGQTRDFGLRTIELDLLGVRPCMCDPRDRKVFSQLRVGNIKHGRCWCGGMFTVSTRNGGE